MFSQFVSSAKVSKQSPNQLSIDNMEEEKYILSLAPFTPLPKITFENVLLGSTATKTLIVRNPGCHQIEICITRVPTDQRIELTWYQEVIGPQEDVLLEIRWYPENEGSSRNTITFTDGGRLKKDVPVIFNCIIAKKKLKKIVKVKVKPKPAVISTKIRSPLRRHFSPTKKSPTKKFLSPTILRKPLPDITNQLYATSPFFDVTPATSSQGSSTNRTYTARENKENVFESAPSTITSSSNKSCMKNPNITFGLSDSQLKSPLKNVRQEFNDSLENVLNVSETIEEKLNRMAMTPNFKIPQIIVPQYNLENSVNCNTKFNISSSTQIKDATIDISPKNSMTNCTISPIKMFENHSETFEISYSNKHKPGLGLIVEETSKECYSAKTFTSNTTSKAINKNNETKPVELKSKFTKTTSLNLKSFFEKTNVQLETSTFKVPKDEVTGKIYNSSKLFRVDNPLLLTATKDIDPFMSSSLYFDTKWVDEQEKGFKKWLNALVTPPSELNSDVNIKIDVSKLWKDCAKREVNKAPTKEVVSNKYHVNSRLESLRRSAGNLFTSPDINEVLCNVYAKIETERLQIRTDRDIHLDISLQAEIMILFVSYNPLWLRIGLETIYNVRIPLHSNSDIMGLSVFISQHYFKDSYLLKKYKTPHSPKYSIELKKLVLKKFLSLVYFLDQAKQKQLIPHDPCLFSKNAPFKESREIVLKFSRDLVSGIGDITKYLKQFGYVLNHKQTYIHEFDYAVTDLGVDLRDGVRLTKVMEIILLRDNLLENMRVPAISRLQKIHNVKIAFEALTEANFIILHDIQPKDIVDGHKEKTLSFLWQIIYKFEAPRLKKAALTIQRWWKSLFITIKRRYLVRLRQKRIEAAIKIQIWFRRIRLAKIYENLIPIVKEIMVQRRIKIAANKIKSFFQMVITRKRYLCLKSKIIAIQAYSRRFLILRDLERKRKAIIKIQSFCKMYIQRKEFKALKSTVLKIENIYVAKKLMRDERRKYLELKLTVVAIEEKYIANKAMRAQREYYLNLIHSILLVQQRFRANKLMLENRNRFLTLKKAAITIQSYYRANKLMKLTRNEYLERLGVVKKSVKCIEEKYLAKKLMIQTRYQYKILKNATILIQRKFRANQLMKKHQTEYNDFKNKVIKIQRWFKNQILLKIKRDNYKKLINAAIVIQTKYRAKLAMRNEVETFNRLKTATIFIQNRFRGKQERKKFKKIKGSAIKIQLWFRSLKKMWEERNYYRKLIICSNMIQRKYKAKLAMKQQLEAYNRLKTATILIQSRFRGNQERKKIKKLKESAIKLQLWFRSLKKMREERNYYRKLIIAANVIQRKYKAKLAMKQQLEAYNRLKTSTILIQSRFRGNQERKEFKKLKGSAIKIQLWFRSLKKMREERNYYHKLIISTNMIQRKYKAKLAMKQQLEAYNRLKTATILIQSRFRGNQERNKFKKVKESAIKIQLCFRSLKKMREERNYYRKLITSANVIQRKYKAKLLMKQQLQEYKTLRLSTIKIQRWYRASFLMKIERNRYLKLKQAVNSIETRYKANLEMRQQKIKYQHLKLTVILVQRKIRANKAMLQCKHDFNNLKNASICVQKHWRMLQLMRSVRHDFIKLKNTTIFIQKKYRAKKLMVHSRMEYQKLKQTTIMIQNKFRANKLMKKQQFSFKRLKEAAIFIQRKFRANLLMKKQRNDFLVLKRAVCIIKDRYMAKKLMVKEIRRLMIVKMAVKCIQDRLRATVLMRQKVKEFEMMKESAKVIQKAFRGRRKMKIEREKFLRVCHACIVIQRAYRSFVERKNLNVLIISLQARVRGFLFRQRFLDEFSPEKIAERRRKLLEEKSAIKIQAYYRGYSIRKRNKKLAPTREKLRSVSSLWKAQNTISTRKERALLVLAQVESCTTSELNRALKVLDYVSRMSKEDCIELSKAIPDYLYDSISVTTRSEPERETITLSTSILINFWKIEESREQSWNADYIDIIITKMTHWCDKDHSLFVYLCTLLWLFAHSNKYKRIIKSTAHCQRKLYKIKTACERKQRMMLRANTRAVVSYFGPYNGFPLPSLEPDWGINYEARPKFFKNAMHAIESLINKLDF
nr:abnormal spindle-like microcephaly-associated protein homolog [Onthophagus taurus]